MLLEDLTKGATVKGILLNQVVTVVDVKWFGSDVIELTYKDTSGRPGNALDNQGRKGTVGFALTILQRRLASSPEAIYQSTRGL